MAYDHIRYQSCFSLNIGLIYRVNFDDNKTLGVQQKMIDQHKAMLSLGHQVTAYFHRGGKVICSESPGIEKVIKEVHYHKNVFDFNKFFSTLRKEVSSNIHNAYYIRYPICTPSFIQFLRARNLENIYIEIPTYPFDDEWKGVQRLYLPFEKVYRRKLSNLCKGIIHFGEEKELFGVPTIRVSNGIDVSKHKVVKSKSRVNLRMIAVGNFNYWHGLDRLINGIKNNEGISLKVIGEGLIIPDLKKMVNQLKLDKVVSFYSTCEGNILNNLFDDSNLGIGTLGIHRKGVSINSSLKHREYASRGLPFIYAGRDWDFEKESFVKIYEEDDESINIPELRKWLNELAVTREEIRNYAVNNLDWQVKLKRVFM